MSKQPIQPLELDGKGVLRFRKNALVCYLLDHGGIDMNRLARQEFPQEDREQFAQLIGYSHDGAGSLSYVSDETWSVALKLYEDPSQQELRARCDHLEQELSEIRDALREGVAALYRIHPEDLESAR